jgi:hypothetical protein
MLLRPGAVPVDFWHFPDVICKGRQKLDTFGEIAFSAHKADIRRVSMRRLLSSALLWFAMAIPLSAQGVTPYEFYRSAIWTMHQQYWKHAFDACVAERNDFDDGRRLSIGRAITGEDFIMVHHMKSLINPGDETVAGKVWINGKTPYDFSGVKPFDSVAVPDEKYVTIYLANGFVQQFAQANTVEIEFTGGRSKHSLRGSRDVIQRLDACMDQGLTRELEPAAPAAPPLRVPLNWFAGTSTDASASRFIAIKLPATATFPDVYLAYSEASTGRFDIRLRADEPSIATRVDPAATGSQRFAVNVLVNDKPVFATLAQMNGNNVDIVDVPAADLMKLTAVGTLTIVPLDPSQPKPAVLTLTADASFGAGAIASPIQEVAAPTGLSLGGLVGSFYVRGRNPDGKLYFGTADTVMEGATLRINWKWSNGKTDTAVANLLQNVVTAVVTGYTAPAIYTIGKDGTWRGTWDNGKATEAMVPKL